MLKAIIFDYNGVLINDLEIHEEAYLLAAKEMGLPLTREIARKYISATALQKRKLYFGDISDATWDRIFQVKTEHYFHLIEKKSPVFPEVGEVLHFLSPRYLLGLISNTPRKYFEKIFPRDLALLFRATTFGDEMRNPKPNPGALIEMMRRLDVTADHCCYVGDSLSDIRMVKAAGIKIFSVATGDNSKKELIDAGSDWILDRLSDLIRELNSTERLS
jgi:beta-phosphoglucomutase